MTDIISTPVKPITRTFPRTPVKQKRTKWTEDEWALWSKNEWVNQWPDKEWSSWGKEHWNSQFKNLYTRLFD